MSEGQYESIIAFYNNIFMLNIKPYILQFAPQASAVSLFFKIKLMIFAMICHGIFLFSFCERVIFLDT